MKHSIDYQAKAAISILLVGHRLYRPCSGIRQLHREPKEQRRIQAEAAEWVKPMQTAGTRVDFSNIDRDKAEIRCVYHLGNKRCASEEKQSLGAIILLLLDRSVGFGDLHNLKEKVRLLTR